MVDVNWEKAAVFTALAIFLSPLLYTHTSALLTHILKLTRRAPSLPWSAVPPGRLHSCHATQRPITPCQHISHVHETKKRRCWEGDTGLAVVLNRAWRGAQEVVAVPKELPLGCGYVATDVRTVLSFILATAPESKRIGRWNVAAGLYSGTKLTISNFRGSLVCHVHGVFQRCRADLTKQEYEWVLDGYPPWYRTHFTSWGGAQLSFPTASLLDVARGGWIVAVGLMNLSIASQTPLALYRCENEPGESEWRGNGVVYRRAIQRCLEHVERHVLSLFPQDVNVNAAVDMLRYLLDKGSASGMQCPGQFRETWGMSVGIPHLRSSEGEWLMVWFKKFRPVDGPGGEMEKLRDMLLPAMAAVVHGAVEVVEYLKDVGVEFKVPDELADLEREVWLRDCASVPAFE